MDVNRSDQSDQPHYQSIPDSHQRFIAISVETLENMRWFMARQLSSNFDSETSIETFGENLEEHLLTLIRAATVKINSQGNQIAAMEACLKRYHIDQATFAEARNTLQSERDANVLLTKGIEILEEKLDLKQACINEMSLQADQMAAEITRLRGVLQRLADWGGVTTYRGGQCWNDVARQALEQDVARGA